MLKGEADAAAARVMAQHGSAAKDPKVLDIVLRRDATAAYQAPPHFALEFYVRKIILLYSWVYAAAWTRLAFPAPAPPRSPPMSRQPPGRPLAA
jgi:hypothetical protein